ncbi:sporulation protein Cse60 [Schinkia azotoformans]|uniref:Sporulation protein Cse60 n=1 Tax=Schinkia azotoformans LMG 9581 TaxID=1131731 RepID=K6DGT7_SCHAZ|nr:sporulation protein Cse60 [Schinkia azotoformans]EKN67479.1 hypothetical protein BAZO_08316 [Schinkia azotoformans LMG 9581]MEC1637362.1 sporulation protein Cse60 [Schinkia azotoformans]MEC1943766.1 sporulation protein Cse60 [Schinkia azotoformans]
MVRVKLIKDENEQYFERLVNEFLSELSEGQLINIQYATTPTAIATHSEYGVYPSVEYSAFIQYKESK